MNKLFKVFMILAIMLLSIVLVGLIDFNINIGSVSKDNSEVKFTVEDNATYYSLSSKLYEANLIKSEFWYKVYIKLNNPVKLQSGEFTLNKNMNLKGIISVLEGGSTKDPNAINLTFKEGVNMRKIASIIENNTDNTVDDVASLLKDKEYLNSLINEYWFITDDILNTNIYYPLEGYLFPETYQVSTKNNVKEIFKVMLDQTDKILTKYKSEIETSNTSIHQILTLASIVELEAGNADDRAGVAGVFYNRLNAGWSLGSDVTTYYGSKIDDFSYSLTSNELNDCSNKYNTRCSSKVGLPVGPIANPGEESIKATVNPSSHNYYYFVADCKGKTYLNQTAQGHSITISNLKSANNWCA